METQTSSKQQTDQKFKDFYRSYRLYVRDLARKRFAHEEYAKELESLVWVEVYRFFERFQEDEPRRLLFQLVTWRARDLYRQHYRHAQHTSQDEVEDHHLLKLFEQSEEGIVTTEQKLALKQALACEQLEDRRLLFGRFLEGLTWEELAMRHNLHRNTLLKRVKASLLRLRQHMEEQDIVGNRA